MQSDGVIKAVKAVLGEELGALMVERYGLPVALRNAALEAFKTNDQGLNANTVRAGLLHAEAGGYFTY